MTSCYTVYTDERSFTGLLDIPLREDGGRLPLITPNTITYIGINRNLMIN